jgi:glucose/arabinose dehydrogenase
VGVAGYASRVSARYPSTARPRPATQLRAATRSRFALALALLGTLTLGACSFGAPDDGNGGQSPNLPTPSTTGGGTGGPPSAVATVIAQGLDVPWGIAFLPDGSALVTERDNKRIVRVGPGSGSDGLTVTPVQTIDEVAPGGEGGLLGIAVSPDYATDGLVFIYYTAASDNRIARFRLGETPVPIVTGIPRGGIHNGGRLAFGPDGFLYASTGETGNQPMAQNLGTTAGKTLRMTKDGAPAPGNPFPEAPLVWSYGHRNVQGMAWDGQGRMFATEFGQSTWDEINRIEPGANYGWPIEEGIGNDPSLVDPIQQWPTSQSSCSDAAMTGTVLVVACLRGERVWLLSINAEGTVEGAPVAAFVGQFGRLRAAEVAPDGAVWVSTSNRDNRGDIRDGDDKILRLVISGGGGGPALM